jgi:hypothetical protein
MFSVRSKEHNIDAHASDVGSIPIARFQKPAKFTLIRLPLLTSHPLIWVQKAGFCTHSAPKFASWWQ